MAIHTSKPGIVIGKQGSNVERLRQLLEQQVGKKVHLKIEEIKEPESDARLVAESIAEQLARRVAYRRAMKQAATQAMRRGSIKGIKIKVGGRLGGAEMSRIRDRDERSRAAAHDPCEHRLRRRSRAYDVWSDRREGLGLSRRRACREPQAGVRAWRNSRQRAISR